MASATFHRVPVEQLYVDDRYQRELDFNWVERTAKKYDARLFGALEVSQRNGKGSYAVFDGQHRLEMAKTLGIPTVPVLIHKKLTPEDEADLFVRHQKNRRNVHPVDRFRALVFQGAARALEIDRIVNEAGYTIRHAGPERGRQRAFNTPAVLDKVYGMGVLPETLALIEACWGGDDHCTAAPLVQGVGLVVKAYGDRISDSAGGRPAAAPPGARVRRGRSGE